MRYLKRVAVPVTLTIGTVLLAAPLTATPAAAIALDSFTECRANPDGGAMLAEINKLRDEYNAPPVVEDPCYSAGAYDAARWMLLNDQTTHFIPGNEAGSRGSDAAFNGILGGDALIGDEVVSARKVFAEAPYHYTNLIDPGVVSVGMGYVKKPYSQGDGLDRYIHQLVIRPHRPGSVVTSEPLETIRSWPSAETAIDDYWLSPNESPDPSVACANQGKGPLPYQGPAGIAQQWYGMPIYAALRHDPPDWNDPNRETVTMTAPVSSDVRVDGRKIETCNFDSKTVVGVGEKVGFEQANKAIVIPREGLIPGKRYTGTVTFHTDKGDRVVPINFSTAGLPVPSFGVNTPSGSTVSNMVVTGSIDSAVPVGSKVDILGSATGAAPWTTLTTGTVSSPGQWAANSAALLPRPFWNGYTLKARFQGTAGFAGAVSSTVNMRPADAVPPAPGQPTVGAFNADSGTVELTWRQSANSIAPTSYQIHVGRDGTVGNGFPTVWHDSVLTVPAADVTIDGSGNARYTLKLTGYSCELPIISGTCGRRPDNAYGYVPGPSPSGAPNLGRSPIYYGQAFRFRVVTVGGIDAADPSGWAPPTPALSAPMIAVSPPTTAVTFNPTDNTGSYRVTLSIESRGGVYPVECRQTAVWRAPSGDVTRSSSHSIMGAGPIATKSCSPGNNSPWRVEWGEVGPYWSAVDVTVSTLNSDGSTTTWVNTRLPNPGGSIPIPIPTPTPTPTPTQASPPPPPAAPPAQGPVRSAPTVTGPSVKVKGKKITFTMTVNMASGSRLHTSNVRVQYKKGSRLRGLRLQQPSVTGVAVNSYRLRVTVTAPKKGAIVISVTDPATGMTRILTSKTVTRKNLAKRSWATFR